MCISCYNVCRFKIEQYLKILHCSAWFPPQRSYNNERFHFECGRRGFDRIKQKTMKVVFVVSPLSIDEKEEILVGLESG